MLPAACLKYSRQRELANITILSVSCVPGSEEEEEEEEEDWSNHWGTSATIKRYTRANAPFEHWGVIATTVGGAVYLTRRFVRAHHLLKAASATTLADKEMHTAFSCAPPHEVKAAALYARRYRVRGAVVGLGVPLLWLAYLRCKHPDSR